MTFKIILKEVASDRVVGKWGNTACLREFIVEFFFKLISI